MLERKKMDEKERGAEEEVEEGKMKTFRLQDGLNRRETQNMQEVVKPPLQSDFWKKTV